MLARRAIARVCGAKKRERGGGSGAQGGKALGVLVSMFIPGGHTTGTHDWHRTVLSIQCTAGPCVARVLGSVGYAPANRSIGCPPILRGAGRISRRAGAQVRVHCQ